MLGPPVLADPATARASAIITQAAVTAGTPASTNRSQLNTYDALNRLIEARGGVPIVWGRGLSSGTIVAQSGQQWTCLLYTSPSPRD